MAKAARLPTRTVAPIHFEDFDGHQFERLVFAYHLHTDTWRSLEWYGQTGSDLGRDIWGKREHGGSVCIQCVNRQRLVASKVNADLNKIAQAKSGLPDSFLVVCASTVSSKVRDCVKEHARSLGIAHCEIWAGHEFEERLRQKAEGLLRRFIEGVIFPDDPATLRDFAALDSIDDKVVIDRLQQVFDRPAFITPFHQESSLPAFRQAIGDTIQALNTGIWQTRDGKEIERLPPRHQLTNPALRDVLAEIVCELTDLRAKFEQFIRDGEIRPCGCNTPDCPVFFFSPRAAREMDALRATILSRVHGLHHGAGKVARQDSSQSVSVVQSTNFGIIANQVTIRGRSGRGAIVIPGSIGADARMYNYVEYLIKRLTEFRDIGKSYGQQRRGRMHPGVTRKILEKQLGGLPKDLPADRFTEVVTHLMEKIDDTAQGRRNRARNVRNYHSFEDHPGSTPT